jgi:uncharacterized protein
MVLLKLQLREDEKADMAKFIPQQIQQYIQILADKVRELWDWEIRTPLRVSIMGQTGVGKSSLINALFNTNLNTDPVRSCTRTISEIPVMGVAGHELRFYDLPGIGEDEKADAKYLMDYRQKLMESDIVIWAINADSRSFTFDVDALRKILENMDKKVQTQLMSKIIFILTKADLLAPSPWILSKSGKEDGDEATFTPQRATQMLLEQKALYFQKQFIRPFNDLLISQTANDVNFNVKTPILHLHYDKDTVYYDGFLDRETLAKLKLAFHQYAEVFQRLHDNYRIIPCSSRFRYNLDLLMRIVIDKLGPRAAIRFSNFYTSGTMDKVSFSEAKHYRNIIVLDENQRRVFDVDGHGF